MLLWMVKICRKNDQKIHNKPDKFHRFHRAATGVLFSSNKAIQFNNLIIQYNVINYWKKIGI